MSLAVWLPLNGDLTNQGLSQVTVTVSGNTTFNTSGKIGQSLTCNGSSFWTITPVTLGNVATIACWTKTSTGGRMPWVITASSSDRLNLYESGQYSLNTGDGNNNLFKDSGGNAINVLTDNLWHHFVVTFDGAVSKLYIDGVYRGTATTYRNPTTTSAKIVRLAGGYNSTHTYDWNGSINDFRIYDHALSAEEVAKLAQGLILHYPLSSPSDILVPEGYQQLEYIESAGAAWLNTGYTFNPETDSFKVTFKGNDTSNDGMIFASGDAKYTWLYYYSAGMRIYITNSSGSQQTVAGPSRDTNKHTAVYNNKHYYFDGTDKGALTGSYVADTSPIHLFAYRNGSSNYPFKGRIYYVEIARSNVMQKIFVPAKRLSDNAIGMYEVYSKTFIPSMTSTAFTAGPNAPVSSPVYDISGFKNHGTITGSLTATAGGPRYKGCTQFPGTAYIDCVSPCAEVKTVSFWAKWDSIPSGQSIIYVDQKSKTGLGLMGTGILINTNQTGNTFSKTNIVANTWYHFVIVSPNGSGNATRKLYINGVEQTATSNTSSWSYTLNELQVGKRSTTSDGFTGKLSDFRMYVTALTDGTNNTPNDIAELYALGKV